jgi:hypothetical protein
VLRSPGRSGRAASEVVDTFGAAAVRSFSEHLSGASAGTVLLAFSGREHAARAHEAGPLAGATSSELAAPRIAITIRGAGPRAHAVSAVVLSQAAEHAPVVLGFSTASRPLLDAIFAGRDAGGIPALTLFVRIGTSGHPAITALADTFSAVAVGSVAENLSESVSGRATLLVRP